MAETQVLARSAYAGQRLVLLTRHGKHAQIAPVLDAALGCHTGLVDSFDTDQLGTFTREIPRAGSQIEAARHKARLAIELGGGACGLGSEGAFFADPVSGMIPWNREVVVLVDNANGIEVTGSAQGPAWNAHQHVDNWVDLMAFAERAGFPAEQLVLRPSGCVDAGLRKGIGDRNALEDAFRWALNQSPESRVLVEADLRAHCSPRRQQRIREAAEDLARRLLSPCPACATPGFALCEKRPGLPCSWCGEPTDLTLAEILGCVRCDHREQHIVDAQARADPAHCAICNP
jgi:hypothetical protein